MYLENFEGTKGEWTAENVLTRNGDFYKVKSGDLSVCNITTRNQAAARANADLIAAAPDMLEALQHLVTVIKESEGVAGWNLNGEIEKWDQFSCVEMAGKAINKALGK